MMEAEKLYICDASYISGHQYAVASGAHFAQTRTSPSSTTPMDSSFSYELPMEWRPSQTFEYQPYPSPYPSPAPSFVSRPPHHSHSHSSSVSNPNPADPPTASPTLSSTTTSSPHVTTTNHSHSHSHSSHNHSHSHSHSASIDPSLQEPYNVHSWSHPPPTGNPQGPQSPILGTNGAQTQSPVSVSGAGNPYATPPPSAKPPSAMSRQELESELARLKTRVNELEVIHHWLELKGMRLETADVPHHHHHHARMSQQGHPGGPHHNHNHHSQQQQQQQHIASVPSITPALNNSNNNSSSINDQPITGGVAPTEEFAASWRSRTDARIKRFCALNRAGNALCAWHDSRRERRAYPPRQAPPGYLNCGCTNEEALFEESLARHGVGSYHPGEMVRMDPALRNPLLKLLEKRFGYVDGDFERDPITGLWTDGEGPDLWESILPAGKPPVSGGRKRGDTK